jgi:hypothetical protein
VAEHALAMCVPPLDKNGGVAMSLTAEIHVSTRARLSPGVA